MENKSHAMAAGIFVLVVAALLAGLAIWLTRDTRQYNEY
jgi:phospholipid/cholesterol/gamma-HCH transport system substrate-binding protein